MFPIQMNRVLLTFVMLFTVTGIFKLGSVKADEPARPTLPELMTTVAKMRKVKSRNDRVNLLLDFAQIVRKKVKALPDGIEDSEIPQAELLFELDLFLSGLSGDSLTVKNCPRTLITIEALSDPNGDGIDLNPSGEAIRGLIQSVCRP